MTKRQLTPNGRRHGLRARTPLVVRSAKTVLTFETRSQVYYWSTDRATRPVIKL